MLSSISMNQALRLWSELEQAYFGKNRFGGSVAEIYIYTLLPASPGGSDNDDYRDASRALVALCKKFRRDRSAIVHIDGVDIDAIDRPRCPVWTYCVRVYVEPDPVTP